MSPTARSLALLRKTWPLVAITERRAERRQKPMTNHDSTTPPEQNAVPSAPAMGSEIPPELLRERRRSATVTCIMTSAVWSLFTLPKWYGAAIGSVLCVAQWLLIASFQREQERRANSPNSVLCDSTPEADKRK